MPVPCGIAITNQRPCGTDVSERLAAEPAPVDAVVKGQP